MISCQYHWMYKKTAEILNHVMVHPVTNETNQDKVNDCAMLEISYKNRLEDSKCKMKCEMHHRITMENYHKICIMWLP